MIVLKQTGAIITLTIMICPTTPSKWPKTLTIPTTMLMAVTMAVTMMVMMTSMVNNGDGDIGDNYGKRW